MSAEKYSVFWCLSESGWTSSSEDSAPDGWVRIYEEKVYQGSTFGRESRTWYLLKTNPSWVGRDADQLERKFSRPEPQTSLSPEDIKALGM
ncbi:MAG: hypothetical protein ABSG96_15780 [Terracidiphilus sp.]|jgi:hypothetical protein